MKMWVVEQDVGYGLCAYVCMAESKDEALEKFCKFDPHIRALVKSKPKALKALYCVDQDVLELRYEE